MLGAVRHDQGALILQILIVLTFGVLALLCIVGGIFAICSNAESKTSFDIFGAHLKTGSVGVALVALGLVTAFLAFQAVLKAQQEIAKHPPESPARVDKTTITQTNIKTGGDNAGRDINKR